MSEREKNTTSRRSFLTSAAGAALATALPSAAQDAAQPKPAAGNKSAAIRKGKRPLNVLWLMSDDMRPELACYASRFNSHSPNIDKLASQGVRFDRNYCQFPLCGPSRSSLFTARLPRETGVLGNAQDGGAPVKHPDWVTIPRLFKEAGYTTLRTGKLFHPGQDDHNGWTDFDGNTESLHPTVVGKKMDVPARTDSHAQRRAAAAAGRHLAGRALG